MRARLAAAGAVALVAALAAGCAQVREVLPGATGPASVTVHVTGDDGSPIEDAVVELACLPDPAVVEVDGFVGDLGSRSDAAGIATVDSQWSGRPCEVRVRPTEGDWRPSIVRVAALPAGGSRVEVVLEGR